MAKPPLPPPTHTACQAMALQMAQLEIDLVLAFSGVYDPDAVRRALAEICLRRAVGAGLTDAPAPVVAKPKVRR
jgi:hypothetical protein